MARKTGGKTSDPKKGAPHHFTGSKLEFLLSQSKPFQEALNGDTNTVSSFYSKVAVDFVKKFGLEEPFHKESTDSVLGEPVPTTLPVASLTEAEASALFTKLRTVS
jgi:hypothetical protein